MDLYLIRHADAQPLDDGSGEDAARPLTPAGQARCAPLAEALVRHGVRLDRIITSPLLRAQQTAEGLIQHWPAPAPLLEVCDLLAPGGKRRKLTQFLEGLGSRSLAVVGHLPDLAEYAAWLIGGRKAQLGLAKAGVARLEFHGRLEKGAGVLTWLVSPEWYAAG